MGRAWHSSLLLEVSSVRTQMRRSLPLAVGSLGLTRHNQRRAEDCLVQATRPSSSSSLLLAVDSLARAQQRSRQQGAVCSG